MKKIVSAMLILVFVFTATGFAAISKANAAKPKLITKSGTILVKNNITSLKTLEATYILAGQVKELKSMNNKEVSVTGYISNKKFIVKNFSLLKKRPVIKPMPPTTPPAIDVKSVKLTGVLVENDLEGKHYELTTKNETFVLVGLDNNIFHKYVGKTVIVTGKIQEDQVNIFQRGKLFKVITIESAADTTTIPIDDFDKTKIKLIDRTGVVMIDKIKGAPVALTVGDMIYQLVGDVDGLEKLNGKTVKVTGYIPDIKYIRAPDYIMFEVTQFTEVK